MLYGKPTNKYGNKWTEYNGQRYQSKKEAEFAMELDLRLKGKDIKSWRRQVPYDLFVNNEKVGKYMADFLVVHNDDSVELIEVKGIWTPLAKFKQKIFRASYLKNNPDVKYRVV